MISPPLFFLCIFGIHHTLSYEKDGKEEWHNPDNIGIPMATRYHPPYFFFSLLRLSLMIFICSAVMRVTPFSLAQSTHPLSTKDKKTLGTFRIVSKASSVNLTVSSALFAAYLTDSRLVFLIGRSSALILLFLWNQKFLLSRYP